MHARTLARARPVPAARRGSLVATSVAVALGLACATSSLDVEPIPLTADPGNRITQLALDLSAARSREIDVLAPAGMDHAQSALERASSLRREGEDVAAILHQVAVGDAALDAAEASADIARTTLAPAWNARSRALRAGAYRLGEPFEAAESRLRELARAIEDGDVGRARASRDALASRYNALELRAIEERTLGDARRTLERAREEGARERVPEAEALAAAELDESSAFIEYHRHADAAMQQRAEVAAFHARRALALGRAARGVEERSAEATVLAQEQYLRQLGERLGLPDLRDVPMDERRNAIESSVASLRRDRDFVVDQNARLREELAASREEVAQLGGRNRALAREQELDALFERARDRFEPDEAEVYRQDGQLVIRLRALDFAVGEAQIEPEAYALLAKVQRVIRMFGSPSVTIEGHTDATGGAALNERLSRERARAVRAYLVANHALPSYRIVAVGRGAADPLAPNTTAEGRALNRRIDVLLDTRRVVTVAAASAGAARSLE
ncbi:MAG: OmpA family protein [Myxococcota bacterium]